MSLKNTELTVTIDKETKTIKTDNKGQFEIELNWATACPSGIKRKRWKRETERINPNYIYIKSKNKEIKIKNKWHKYAELFREAKDKVTMKQDLNFS